ncbi:hypothetical protein TNCV_3778451 [Trichonephila clavipes]|nr:hypothetical protein TNCV_3778451 [Trichonephila clavipes]
MSMLTLLQSVKLLMLRKKVTPKVTQDQTKYSIVLSALDKHNPEFIEDILADPPAENKYIVLKSALLNRLSDSEEAKLKKLLGNLELSDRHPSDLLHQMKNVAGSKTSEK